MSKQLGNHWKIHTPRLLEEILKGSGQAIYKIPLNMLGKMLASVGEHAARINDPELNHMMAVMTIYTVADPESPDYSRDKLDEIELAARAAYRKRTKKKPTSDDKQWMDLTING